MREQAMIGFLMILACGCRSAAPAPRIEKEEASGRSFLAASLADPLRAPITDAEIETLLHDAVDSDKLAVGLVVGTVDRNGTRIISRGKLKSGEPGEANGDTLFEIGSITKLFTTLLLQDMVDRGEMKLDDPVQKYLPSSVRMPTHDSKQITLLHLATHTSALPRDAGRSLHNADELYAFLSGLQLKRDPGAQVEYSNLGVGLLGHVIALKAGKDYEALVLERICQPLGMQSTRIVLPPELKARLATGHVLSSRPAPERKPGFLPGAGALCSTANDLLKFAAAEVGLTSSPLTAAMRETHEPHRLESGLELRLAWQSDPPILSHGGLIGGSNAYLGCNLPDRRGAVVLSNCLNVAVVDAISGPAARNESTVPRSAPIDRKIYDGYIGEYRSPDGMICSVRREGERLLIRGLARPGAYWRMPSVEFFPQSETFFYNKLWDCQATFVPDPNGGEPGLILKAPNFPPLRIVRVSSQPPAPPLPVQVDPKIYDGFVGHYRHALLFGWIPVGPTLNVWRDHDDAGDHLMAGVHDMPGFESGEMFPESETDYFSNDIDARVKFVRDASGKANRIVVTLNGKELTGVRMADRSAKEERPPEF